MDLTFGFRSRSGGVSAEMERRLSEVEIGTMSTPRPRAIHKSTLGLHRDYEALIRECWERHGSPSTSLKVEAISLGNFEGRETYVVLLSVVNGDPVAALQLPYVASVVERRVADAVRSTWLGDHSRFGGVWTHWPAAVRVPDEVRRLLQSLKRSDPRSPAEDLA